MTRVKWRQLPTSYQLLAGVAGAVGVLALPQAVQDGFLRSGLARYVDGYRNVIQRVSDATVGWIHVGWLRMTEFEALLVSVSLILGSAALRAILEDIAPFRPETRLERAATALAGMLYGILPLAVVLSAAALFLPTPATAAAAVAVLAFVMWMVMDAAARYRGLANDPESMEEAIQLDQTLREAAYQRGDYEPGEPLSPEEIEKRAGVASRLRTNLLLAPGIAMVLALFDLALR